MTSGSLRSVQRWLAHQGEPVRLELLCAEHLDPATGDGRWTAIRLSSCAAEVGAHELVELLTLGAERVTVALAGCGDVDRAVDRLAPLVQVLEAGGVDRLRLSGTPSHRDDHPVAAERAGTGQRIWGRGRPRRRPVLDAARMPIARRQALGLGGAAARELPPEYTAPQERLVEALRTLIEPGPELEALEGPAARLVASGCTACGVCVQACPADVLGLRHGSAGGDLAITTLVQQAEACTGCLRCVELCPTDALQAAGAWSWAQILDGATAGVATVTTARCERCGTRFPTSQSARWCQVCTYRRQHPFGSTLPPRMRPHQGPAAQRMAPVGPEPGA